MDTEIGRGESPQVRTKRVTVIVSVILALLVAIAFGFQALFPDRIGQTFAVSRGFPAPAVIANERAERLALEARQKSKLHAIHIEAAVKTIAAKGPHAFDPVGSAP